MDAKTGLEFTKEQLLTEEPETVNLSVTIIAKKGAEKGLAKLIDSLYPFTRKGDEIIILDTGTEELYPTDTLGKIYSEADIKVIRHPLVVDIGPYVKDWLPEWYDRFKEMPLAKGTLLDFSEARKIVTEAAANDIVFWIDSDDVLNDPDNCLRELIDRVFTSQSSEGIFLNYNYAFDKTDGQVTTILKRERIFDRTKFEWIGRCHETAIPTTATKPVAWFQDLRATIDHTSKAEGHASDIRNYVILRREIEEYREQGRPPDPRSIFYLGNAARGLDRFEEAVELYQQLIDKSGSRDDRFAAAYHTACIYLHPSIMRPMDGMDWSFKCIRFKPEDPRGYIGVAQSYFFMQQYEECLHWLRVARSCPEPADTLHSYDPTHIHVVPRELAALTYQRLGNMDGAIEAVNDLRNLRPNHPRTLTLQDAIGNWHAAVKLEEGLRSVAGNLDVKTAEERFFKLREIVGQLRVIPEELEDRGLAKPETVDVRELGKGDLVFMCGSAPEYWGPGSAKGGIGGSEKAVIEMSKRLQRFGHRVTVYAKVPPEQRGLDTDTGVRWEHVGAFDRRVPRGTVIYWRSPEMLESPIKAQKRIVWCHDVQDERRWTAARIALADQVWVLSEFHKTTLGSAAAKLGDKVIVTRNGIDNDLFQKYHGKVERDPGKIVFASTPDRGVLSAIRAFKGLKTWFGDQFAEKGVDPKLHIYYGFNALYLKNAAKYEYAHLPDINRDVNLFEYWQLVLQTMDQDDDIIMHGRIGFDEMAKEYCSAGVWLYPTRFDEISCMVAMEAQRAGCCVVATDKAALAETVDWSSPLARKITDLDDVYQQAGHLFSSIQVPADDLAREMLAAKAAERFDYDALAQEWTKLVR